MHLTRRSLLATAIALALVLPFAAPRILDAQSAKRAMDIEDVIAYRGMGASVLSDNGQWVAYRMAPTEGDAEVIVRGTTGDKELKFPVGSGGGAQIAFSADGQWVAFSTNAKKTEMDAARRASRPAPQPGVTLVKLSTGDKTEIAKIRSFDFNNEMGGWIALHRYGADAGAAGGGNAARGGGPGRAGGDGGTAGDTRPKGTDLVLHELATGNELNIGNVGEFAFDKSGKHLALVIDAADQAGNGVQLRDMATGAVTPLESDKAFYSRLAFSDEGDALVVLKGHDDTPNWKDRLFAVVGWTGVDKGAPAKVSYDPAKDASFPQAMSISGNRAPRWSEGRDAIVFGIASIKKADPPAGRGRAGGANAAAPAGGDAPAPAGGNSNQADRPNLVLWHYKDGRLQSQQQVQESLDRNFSYLSVYRVGDKKFVRLADDEMRNVAPGPKDTFAIGTDNRDYELQGNLDGRQFRDAYAVNMQTGERKLLKKKAQYGYSISPDGTKYFFYEGKHFFVVDLATGAATNVTAKVPTSFVDVEDDHNQVDPPLNPVGWTSDSKFLLLNDDWDIWKVSADASAPAVNLTVNGKKDQIRYRQRYRIDPDEEGIDLSQPQYIGFMYEWTKKQGIARLVPGATGVSVLVSDDAAFSRLDKADKADTWIYSRETVTDVPELYVTNASLANGRKITNTQAEIAPYAWTPGRMLIDFQNDKKTKAQPKGEHLQATLYLPANYEKGKTYPTIVYIYERLTQSTNNFSRPSVPGTGFNRAFYLSNGYAVLEPDIKYYINDPGMSAVWALVPAVKAAIATGVVDPARVALHGHSWGGYQTAFTITQTNIFKAAAAGAPLTDMISMYALIYKNSGGTNGAIFENSQGRFTSGPWDNWDAYTRNSPVRYAKNVTSPLLMLHNDTDGAVDFTQGVEYFNTLRRLGKPVWLVEYPGENHGLARQPNMQDYMIRMKEFFDHYLMDTPAPAWLTDGISRMGMAEDIDKRLKAREDAKKAKGGGA
jgi:dipeptidyl aminopeptidase/acylaminoacyl peptidase